jgi:hypothetical protein
MMFLFRRGRDRFQCGGQIGHDVDRVAGVDLLGLLGVSHDLVVGGQRPGGCGVREELESCHAAVLGQCSGGGVGPPLGVVGVVMVVVDRDGDDELVPGVRHS